jgi:trigger factor
MQTTVSELPESRVRVDVEVEPDDVETRIQSAATRLGQEMKIPGFREGKVPAEMVLQRVGREAVLSEALESSLGDWYERAMLDAAVNPVGDPKLDLTELPGEGEPLKFAIEVAVRPEAKISDYKGLEVGRVEPQVPADAVDAELENLRQGFAKLNPVDRPAADGDAVLIDYEGLVDGESFEGGEARDYLLELGAGRVLPEFEAALPGAKGGDEKEVTVTFPDDYPPEELRGKEATFKIKVKEVREKELPELDDDFASEASEFETVAELRDFVGSRIKEALEQQADERFRADALDAAAEKVTMDLPDAIVTARAEEMWRRLERTLGERGISPDAYAQAQGKTREELLADVKPDAEKALKREAALQAVADAENIEVTEDEMLEALTPPPGHEDHGHPEPAEALEQLRESGREEMLKDDLRMRRALELIAAEAKPIPVEQAEAREKIWTPEKEREEKGGLWTPGSGEPPPETG